jgi:hypothetical protein
LQKSQNGGTGIPLPGAFDVAYHRYGSRVAASAASTLTSTELTPRSGRHRLPRAGQHEFLTAGLRQIAASVAQATRTFSPSHPEKLVPLLATGMKQTQSLMQKVSASDLSAEEKYNVLHELAVKEAQFNSAIVEALGVTLTAVVAPSTPDRGRSGFAVDAQDTFTTAIPGQSFGSPHSGSNPSAVPIQIQSVSLRSTGIGDWHITASTSPLKGALQANQRQAADFQRHRARLTPP